MIRQVEKKKITVVLNTKITPEMLGDDYDVVVAAVGAEPIIPQIPGVDRPNVTVAASAIMSAERVGKNVVVIGGGEVGVETGMLFA